MAIADVRSKIENQGRPGPSCEVCQILDGLPDTESSALRSLLADSTVRYSVLADALRDDPDTKIDISAYTLSRHARGRCGARERLR